MKPFVIELFVKNEIQIKGYTRRTKSGKTIQVQQHQRKGEARREEIKKIKVKKQESETVPEKKGKKVSTQDPEYIARAKKLYSAGKQTQARIAKKAKLGDLNLKHYTIKGIVKNLGGVKLPDNTEKVRIMFRDLMRETKDFVVDNGGIKKAKNMPEYKKRVGRLAEILNKFYDEVKKLNEEKPEEKKEEPEEPEEEKSIEEKFKEQLPKKLTELEKEKEYKKFVTKKYRILDLINIIVTTEKLEGITIPYSTFGFLPIRRLKKPNEIIANVTEDILNRRSELIDNSINIGNELLKAESYQELLKFNMKRKSLEKKYNDLHKDFENLDKTITKELTKYFNETNHPIKPDLTGESSSTAKSIANYLKEKLPIEMVTICSSLNGTSEIYQPLEGLDNWVNDPKVRIMYGSNNYKDSGGFYNTRTGKIAIRGGNDYAKWSLVHEIAHSIWFQYLRTFKPEQKKEVEKMYEIYKEDPDKYEPVTKYSMKNEDEFFAEHFKHYLHYPSMYRFDHPQMAKLIDEIVPLKDFDKTKRLTRNLFS